MMEVHQKRSELVKDTPQCQRLRLELSHSLDQRVKDRLAGCRSGPQKQHRTKDTPGTHISHRIHDRHPCFSCVQKKDMLSFSKY